MHPLVLLVLMSANGSVIPQKIPQDLTHKENSIVLFQERIRSQFYHLGLHVRGNQTQETCRQLALQVATQSAPFIPGQDRILLIAEYYVLPFYVMSYRLTHEQVTTHSPALATPEELLERFDTRDIMAYSLSAYLRARFLSLTHRQHQRIATWSNKLLRWYRTPNSLAPHFNRFYQFFFRRSVQRELARLTGAAAIGAFIAHELASATE